MAGCQESTSFHNAPTSDPKSAHLAGTLQHLRRAGCCAPQIRCLWLHARCRCRCCRRDRATQRAAAALQRPARQPARCQYNAGHATRSCGPVYNRPVGLGHSGLLANAASKAWLERLCRRPSLTCNACHWSCESVIGIGVRSPVAVAAAVFRYAGTCGRCHAFSFVHRKMLHYEPRRLLHCFHSKQW